MATKLEGGGTLVAGPLKKTVFCGFPLKKRVKSAFKFQIENRFATLNELNHMFKKPYESNPDNEKYLS